jgi:hypothetical protein
MDDDGASRAGRHFKWTSDEYFYFDNVALEAREATVPNSRSSTYMVIDPFRDVFSNRLYCLSTIVSPLVWLFG